MCSVEPLREFIRERLTAAAEEIFTQLEKTIVRYEEEIDRQRRLLDLTWRPRTQQNPAELQHHFFSEELPTERDSSSSPDRDAPEPAPDDVCSRQDAALVLKQETEAIMVTVDYDDEPQPSSYQLLCQNRPETQNRNQEVLKPKKTRTPSDRLDLLSQNADGNLYSCPICGKCFAKNSYLTKHKRIHTSEKPFVCNQCGKAFSNTSYLANHKKTHSGMKPFACLICGKVFTQQIHVTDHMRIHTGEKPFPCATCGKHFRQKSSLNKHLRTQHQKLEA
ncbi:zinc finger protein 2 homolog [Gambusia affinis]|uniref:zinc finger protein 2 homolog n=1 Tax=Gambusia affinis TaxID=33528 RepID=UPI001CDCCCE3|nr:zinc finger protein 2 homolog [Gambusia affinis]